MDAVSYGKRFAFNLNIEYINKEQIDVNLGESQYLEYAILSI